MLSSTKINKKFYLTIRKKGYYTEITPKAETGNSSLKKQTAKKPCECFRERENSFSGKGGKNGVDVFGMLGASGKSCCFGSFGESGASVLLSEKDKIAEKN